MRTHDVFSHAHTHTHFSRTSNAARRALQLFYKLLSFVWIFKFQIRHLLGVNRVGVEWSLHIQARLLYAPALMFHALGCTCSSTFPPASSERLGSSAAAKLKTERVICFDFSFPLALKLLKSVVARRVKRMRCEYSIPRHSSRCYKLLPCMFIST